MIALSAKPTNGDALPNVPTFDAIANRVDLSGDLMTGNMGECEAGHGVFPAIATVRIRHWLL